MTTDTAHTRWWQMFEVVVGIPLLVAIALHLMVPLVLPHGVLTRTMMVVGVALILAGATLVVLARRELAQRGQPTDPGLPTSTLVTTGVFSISRNPLYLGGMCLLVGIALVLNLPWIVVLLLPAILACHYLLITPEERYLATKFGAEYQTYAASVQRWMGRARHSKQP
ncbi:MAG TPA: isoprenylcysteine carboxylmethyltransferase family protein [Herpetosiphonaceae bacterium]